MTKETFVPQDPNAIIFSVGSDRGEDINQGHCGGSGSCIIVLSQRDVSAMLGAPQKAEGSPEMLRQCSVTVTREDIQK